MDPKQTAWWEEQYSNLRRPATETGFEFRYEFALRSIQIIEQENQKFLHNAWEMYGFPADESGPASDGRDQMPAEFREEYDRKVKFLAKIEQLSREAKDGETSWRASVNERLRPRITQRSNGSD